VSADVEIRRAEAADADDMADAHRDSIRSLGAAHYSPDLVEAWQEGVSGELYVAAMDLGEVFFIATGTIDGRRRVLGFSSDYTIEGTTHGTSAYVRGAVARQGIGARLLRTAEAYARERGATAIEIDASLGAVDFYRANGFEEVSRGETTLTTGRRLPCVFMRKELGA
jgi:putative acetyltransferase